MHSHNDIWRAIDRLASDFGYSASGLAKKAGLDPTAFNKSKRANADGKPRWPSTESIAKILAVTGMSMTDFFALTDEGNDNKRTAPAPHQSSRTLPLLGFAQAGREGFFDEDGAPAGAGWDQVDFPAVSEKLKDKGVYALEVSGNSMEPLYRAGDVIVVSRHESLRRGDRVVVRTRKGEIMAKELVRQGADKVELRSLNPDHAPLLLDSSDISWIARIIWVSQ